MGLYWHTGYVVICRLLLVLFIFYIIPTFISPPCASATEFTGDIALEGRGFLASPAYPDQRHHSASFAVNAEVYHELSSGSSFLFKPFFRMDSADSERTHGDIREANFLYLADTWEMTVGIGKVFWGATEFVHLVDIINQTDLVEALDGEEKLGQPMVHASFPRPWGTVDLFALPWFRERTYPGKNGRLRFPLPVDTDDARYESPSEQSHLDLALRYSHSYRNFDIGIYYFDGTGREPLLILDSDTSGEIVLVPYYEQIGQTGVDLQVVTGNWLWKGEALYRTGQGNSFFASTFGFEYTYTGIADTPMDLGLIGEYVFDDRDDRRSPTVYDNDAMFGIRLAANDAAGTECLLGLILDTEISSKILSLESSRRLGENIKINLEGALFIDMDEKDPANSLAEDDFIKLEVIFYF
jgi:hypothetical protein